MSCTINYNGSEYSIDEFKGLIRSGEIDPRSLLSFQDVVVDPSKHIEGVTRKYNLMPFRVQAGNIEKGGLVFSLQPDVHNIGTYRDPVSNRLFNVFPMGQIVLRDYLASRNISQKKFEEGLSDAEKKSDYMKEFLKGERALSLHRVEDVDSFEDELPDIDDVRFARIYDAKLNTVRRLRSELKTAKGERREVLRHRIDSLNEQMRALNKDENRTISALLNMIRDDIDTVDNVLNSTTDRKSLEYAKGLVENYVTILSADFSQDIDFLEEETKLQALSLIPRATRLLERIDNQFMLMGDKIIKDYYGSGVLVNGLPTHTKDIGVIDAYLKDTTENPNKIIQVLTRIIKKAQKELSRRYVSFKATNKKFVDALESFQKGMGLKKEDYYDYMLQVDENNKRTGNFVARVSDAYAKARIAASKDTIKELQFLAKNHHYTVDQEAWKAKREWLIEYYISHYSENIKMTEYDERKGTTYEQKVYARAKNWADAVDPNKMVEYLGRIKADPDQATNYTVFYEKFKKRGGFKSRVKIEDKWFNVMDMTVSDHWIDPKWAAIQRLDKTDPRRAFYDHWSKNVYAGREKLSEEEIYLPRNYIPEKTKDLGVGGNTRQWIVNNLSQKISQNIHGVDLVTGEIDKKIPVYMLNNTLSPENKSYDLGNVLDSFMKEVISFEEKSEIEDDANLLLYLLGKQDVTEVGPTGQAKNVNGRDITRPGRTSNNFAMAQYRLNAALYDERQDKELVSSFKMRDVVVQRELKKIRKEIDELGISELDKAEALEYVTNGGTYAGKNVKIQEYIRLATLHKRVSGNFKYITGNKIANTLIYYTSIKLLGLNIFGGFAEMLQGAFSLFTESGAKRYFNDGNAAKGMGRVFRSMTPWDNEEKSRIRNISKAFDAQGKVFQEDEQNNIVSKVAYWQWEQANFLMNNSFLFAVLEHETIKDDKGTVHKLADVLECDEHMNLSWKNGMVMEHNLHNEDGRYSDYTINLMMKFKEVLKNNRERQSFEDPIQLEKKAIFRMIGQFKKNWLFRAFYARFDDYKEADLFSQHDTKGFYRSFFDLFTLPTRTNPVTGEKEMDTSLTGMAGAMKNVLKAWYRFSVIGKIAGADTSQYGELDEANLRKFAREVGMVTTIAMVLICLSASGGDDDRKGGMTYAINQLVRLQRDLSTYMSPSSLASIIKNPLPVMSTVMDLSRVLESLITGRYLYDPYLNEGKSTQKLRIVRDVKRNVPFINQIDKHISKFNRQITYEGN